MKLADAVAVYEGRRPPSMSALPVDKFTEELLATIVREMPDSDRTSAYSYSSRMSDELTKELERIYPLDRRIKRLGGERRPRKLHWMAYTAGSEESGLSLQNLYIRGIPYRSQNTRTAVNIVQYGRRFYSAAHRALAQAAGLDELDMLVLLGCGELSTTRRRNWRRWHETTATQPVAAQYVELLQQLRSTVYEA